MVSPGIMQQGSLFLHAMAFGVALIFCYDLLRIFRRGVPHGTVWIAVEDMFFWLISAFVLFQLMYEENDGTLRWFVIMGVLLGMILYNVSLSRFVVRFGSFFFRLILRVIRAVIMGIVKILQFLLKPLGKCIQRNCRTGKKSSRYVKKQLKKLYKTVKMGLCKL